MRIIYLSHGANETGGYLHEQLLAAAIAADIKNCDLCVDEIRFRKNYRGIFGWIQLFFQGFFAAKGDIIITVARLAWPVYLRNIFTKSRILVVLHNYAPGDGKPRFYYTLLNSFLKIAARKKKRMGVVVVANFWKQYFLETLKYTGNIFHFPNLFETAKYYFFRDIVQKKSKLIHLGQYSAKIDRKAYLLLVHALQEKGFSCYFSDNSGADISDLPVTFFQNREAYLKQMALSSCTVILNKLDEGWNRVAHESMLVGTPVIAFPGGGLEELVRLGNGSLVQTVEEAAAMIENGNFSAIDYAALESLDAKHAPNFVQPLIKFLQS